MNLAYVNADAGIPLFSGKGAAVHVRDFAQAARRVGHHVRVLTSVVGETQSQWSLPFERIPERHGTTEAPSEARGLGRNLGLRAALARRHQQRAFDLIYERYSLWSHAALGFARRRALPYVLEVNSPLVVEQSTYRQLAKRETARRIERYLFSAASRVVAVSAEVAAYVCDNGGDSSRVLVAVNGVDLSLYRDVLPTGAPGERFTVGFLGSLKAWHGLDVLLDALAHLVATDERYHLRVIGDGPERAALLAGIDRRGLGQHVTLVGQVAREQVPEHLRDVDVTVAPYPRLDGFYFSPLKIFEYMAAGRPIVASRIGQIESVLCDGETALLVEPGNASALAASIESLRAQPALAARLAAAARARAFTRHGWEHTVSTAIDGVVGVPA
jgi:glycosyltransferase involved in cell wall biosynthesis